MTSESGSPDQGRGPAAEGGSGTAVAPRHASPVTQHASRSLSRAAEWVTAPLLALLIAVVVGDLLILAFGQSPGSVYRLLLEGTWGNAYGLGQVLYKATTLTFTGLSVALGIRAGLFNIGAESQLAFGGFCAAAAGLAMPAGVPAIVAVPLAVAAAGLGGGAVGAVPGALKARFGASEVIVTIMLNFVVLGLLNWIVSARLRVPETLHTPPIDSGHVPRLVEAIPALQGSAANATVLLALAAAAAVGWYLFRTRAGYELRAVGLQPEAAEYGGVSVGGVYFRTMVLAGALAGVGGTNFVLGYRHYYEEGLAAGSGFIGIAVALVGRNHPLGVVLAALLFATISQGGLAVNAVVPKQMVEVLTAVVILAVAVTVPEVQRLLRTGRAVATA